MADEIMPNSIGMGNYPKRLADMNDGTWAEKVLATLALGGSQISQANPLPVTVASGTTPIADQSVVDSAGTYWLVRDNGTGLSYINWATGASGTPVAPVAPAGKLTGEQVLSTQYNALAAGTGFAVGDVLAHFVILNIATNPASVLASSWLNLTQGSVLSTTPSTSVITELTASMAVTSLPPLPAGSNAIGSVAVSTLPALPAGANTIGTVTLGGSLPGFAATPTVALSSLPPLASGTNLIGAVNLDIGGAAVGAGNPVPVSGTLALGAGSSTIGSIANSAFAISGSLPAGSNAIGSVTVSNFPATQTVAGTVTANAGTGTFAVSAATLPLPTGAATDASLTNGNQKTQVTALPALPAGSNLIGAVNLDIAGSSISATNAVPVYDAYQAPVANTWNTTTTVNTAAAFTTAGYDMVIVTLGTNAAFAGGIVVFEVYDGVNWMPVKSASIINYTTTAASIAPAANATVGYQVPVAGFPQFRVRLSSVLTAGTLTVTGIISSAPDTSVVTIGMDPAQPLPAGTNTLGGVNVDTVVDATTQTASASSAAVILTQSAVGFSGGSFRVSGTFTATVVLEGSNDGGTTWDTLVFTAENASALPVTSATAAGMYRFNTTAAQVRLRVSAYTSGTVSAVIAMKRNAQPTLLALGQGNQQIGAVALSALSGAGTGVTALRVTTGASGVIKASAGKLYGSASIVNALASARYLQIYNKTTAGVPGTDTPAMTIALAASAILSPTLFSDIGVNFATGISWAITTDFAGATAGASGDVLFTLNYV